MHDYIGDSYDNNCDGVVDRATIADPCSWNQDQYGKFRITCSWL